MIYLGIKWIVSFNLSFKLLPYFCWYDQEEEEPPEVKEEKEKEKKKTTKEEEEECHWLLEQITKEQWFPRNTPKTVPNIVSSFMEFMGNVDDAVHTKICDYIVQIHKYVLLSFQKYVFKAFRV